jgi:hypothetical protein
MYYLVLSVLEVILVIFVLEFLYADKYELLGWSRIFRI